MNEVTLRNGDVARVGSILRFVSYGKCRFQVDQIDEYGVLSMSGLDDQIGVPAFTDASPKAAGWYVVDGETNEPREPERWAGLTHSEKALLRAAREVKGSTNVASVDGVFMEDVEVWRKRAREGLKQAQEIAEYAKTHVEIYVGDLTPRELLSLGEPSNSRTYTAEDLVAVRVGAAARAAGLAEKAIEEPSDFGAKVLTVTDGVEERWLRVRVVSDNDPAPWKNQDSERLSWAEILENADVVRRGWNNYSERTQR